LLSTSTFLTVPLLTGCCLFRLMLVVIFGQVWPLRAERLTRLRSAELSFFGLPERAPSE
jgi:hypothetical protein